MNNSSTVSNAIRWFCFMGITLYSVCSFVLPVIVLRLELLSCPLEQR